MPELTPHQKKALNFKDHISLTANAGSGKTFVLSKRYVEIALNENVSLRNIAAITFTDKAAGDLYKKIAQEIDSRIDAEAERIRKRKLEQIRRQLVSANISTIHSFCIDIIREFPIESNIDANFSPIEKTYSKELIEISVEEALKLFINSEENSHVVKSLIRLLGSKNKLAEELASLIENKKNVINLFDKIYSGSDDEIADYFYNSFVKILDKTILANKEEIIESVKRINNHVLSETPESETGKSIDRLLNSITASNVHEILAKISNSILTASSPRKVRKKGYLKNAEAVVTDTAFIEKYLPEIEEALAPENHREVELELAKYGKQIITLFEASLKRYEEKKKEGGYLDFEDILLTTQEILRNETVRQKLSEKYQYLMIDEYQDTNEIQYNIFLPILENLTKNNLFVVGDEKQSIYMFRDAELEIFERTRNDIKKNNGEKSILNLPDSFRMAPEICVFTNYLFKRLFNSINRVYNEVRPDDLVCGRNDNVEGKVELLINKTEDDEGKKTNTELADLIAQRINGLMFDEEFGVKYKFENIAVLCRKRKSFPVLEKAFTKYGIPYTVMGGKGFYQKQLVGDFYNYFAFLLNPDNDAALAGILRSPFFSVDDSVLYSISLVDGKFSFWEKLKKLSEQNVSLQKVVKQIEQNIRLKTVLDIASLFRKILSETNFISVIASQKNNSAELENLNKLINLSIRFFEEGFRTLYDYVVFLKDSISFSDDEGQAEAVSGDDSVKIMTIHQSKGLEYEAVFLFNCGEKSQKSYVKSKSIKIDKNFGLLTKVPLNGKYFDEYFSAPIVTISDHITKKKELAELKRLFYVAVTRAKTSLFISTDLEKGKFPEDSLMGLMQEVFAFDFNEENFTLKSNLSYLLYGEKGYYNIKKDMVLTIPIKKEVEFRKQETVTENNNKTELKNFSSIINDLPDNEIYSATKIAAYIQCPLKYKLNFEFDFSQLFKDYNYWKKENLTKPVWERKKEEIEYSKIPEITDEEGIAVYPELKGKIIHSILQNNINGEQLNSYIKEQISNDFYYNLGSEKEAELLTKSIKNDINIFYNSAIYKEISSKNNADNEFELFVKENDYILHGIIDKLIVEKDVITIVDYKTDNIDIKKLDERYKSYLSQLKFYSYIVYKHFKIFSKIIVRVIFIKYPEQNYSEEIKTSELLALGKEYQNIISKIRKREFLKKTDHCSKCSYSAIGNNCIVR